MKNLWDAATAIFRRKHFDINNKIINKKCRVLSIHDAFVKVFL